MNPIPTILSNGSNVQLPKGKKSPLDANQLEMLKGFSITVAKGTGGSDDTFLLYPNQRVTEMTTGLTLPIYTRTIALIEPIRNNNTYIRGEQVYQIFYKESGAVFVGQSDLEVLLDRKIEALNIEE